MASRPAFLPSFHVEPVEADGVCLLSEREHVVLQGRIYAEMAPLLDGTRSVADLIADLDGRVSPAEVHYALGRLERAGYLTRVQYADRTAAAFRSGLGLAAHAVAPDRGTQMVGVVALGSLSSAPLVAALADLGISTSSHAPGSETATDRCGLLVVLAEDYLSDELADLNVATLGAGRPWLLIKPSGSVLWFGPHFEPGRTACWECLAHRLRGNREVEAFLAATRPARPNDAILAGPVSGSLGGDGAISLAALEVAKIVTAASADSGAPVHAATEHLRDAVVTIDLLTFQAARHRVTRRPTCPACGTAGRDPARAPRAPQLRSQVKRFTADGGHRTATPAETLARFGHHISPITGVVTALEPVADADRPFGHVYAAAHNLGGRRDTLAALRRWLATSSSGKGMTDAQARASGLCEALERHSGTFQGDEIRHRATRRDLGTSAIDPNACMLFSRSQYASRDAANGAGTHFNLVPEPLPDDVAVEWSPVWSLTEHRFKHLPTEFLYYGVPRRDGARYCFADSNGCAAGNSLEEAVLQGLLELFERDSVSLWWYNRVRRPAIDLDSFDEPFLHDLRQRHRESGRELWALDLTADLEVPVIAVLSRRVDRPAGTASDQIMFGFGAHVEARIALLRACTEVNQFAASSVRLDDQQRHPGDDPDHRRWWSSATWENQPFVQPLDGPSRRRSDFSDWGYHDLLDDVDRCRQILEGRGLEVLVLDQTRADIGLPVVKVIVPGLRHYYARFAPGRLFDVPVRLGWLDRPTLEANLNPTPMFR